MPLETEVPKYDPDGIQELLDEGYTETEAIRILSTTMNGASEDEEGGIVSTQTFCDVLDYDETLIKSREAERARETNESLVREELGLEDGEDIDEAVDNWIREQEKKLGRR